MNGGQINKFFIYICTIKIFLNEQIHQKDTYNSTAYMLC